MTFLPRACTVGLALLPSLLASVLAQPVAHGAAWDADNAPARFGALGSTRFADLPTSGKAATRPWTGHSWKERQGGIAFRWQSGVDAWSYTPPSTSQIGSLSEKDIALLSPAEKFDLLSGRNDFPTVWNERNRNDAKGLSWYGLCHGWALSATLFQEPRPVVMTSPSGRAIPFGSADVKALLAYYVGEAIFSRREIVGLRCWGSAEDSPACRDMNAGAFHLLLANEVGRKKRSFVVELSADEEIWNKPVLSFSSQVEGRRAGASAGAAPGTKEEISVATTVTYVHNGAPEWNAQPGSDSLRVYTYRYRLELNAGSDVIGGAWTGGSHPDFAWTLLDPAPLSAILPGSPLEKLGALYAASTGDACALEPARCRTDTLEPRGQEFACPAGFNLTETPALLKYCVKNEDVVGAITPVMRDACRLSGRGAVCESDLWPAPLYVGAAGEDRCPRGSVFDEVLSQCVDDTAVYGPFRKSQVVRCNELPAHSGQLCSGMRWQTSLHDRVIKNTFP